MNKVYLVYDKTKSSLKIKSYLLKKIQTAALKKANIIIVLGGDGFMLQTLKRLYKFNKPFYGVNSGNYGFLMNKLSIENIIKNLNELKSMGYKPFVVGFISAITVGLVSILTIKFFDKIIKFIM